MQMPTAPSGDATEGEWASYVVSLVVYFVGQGMSLAQAQQAAEGRAIEQGANGSPGQDEAVASGIAQARLQWEREQSARNTQLLIAGAVILLLVKGGI
jgi:hypothetical protein